MHPVFGLLMSWLTRRQNRFFFPRRPDTDIPNGCEDKRVAKHFVLQALSVKHTESVTEFRVKTCFFPTVWCEDVEEKKRGGRRVNEPYVSQWVFRVCFTTLLLILQYSKHLKKKPLQSLNANICNTLATYTSGPLYFQIFPKFKAIIGV